MRYKAYGHEATEREDNRGLAPGASPDSQKVTEENLVYETDDRDEAKAIRQAGGFIHTETQKWVVVTSVVDSVATPGPSDETAAPENIAVPKSTGGAISKLDVEAGTHERDSRVVEP